MNTDSVYYIALISLLIACIISLRHYSHLSRAFKFITFFLCTDFIAEILAFIFGKLMHNNMVVYGVYSPIELLLISAYFNYSIPVFKSKNIGLYIGFLGVIVGILNAIFLQPLNGTNNYFLFFQGIVTICMCLFAFTRILLEEAEQHLTRNPHFWMGIVVIFYWTITFCNWGLYDFLYFKNPSYSWVVDISMFVIHVVTYLAMGVILLYSSNSSRYE